MNTLPYDIVYYIKNLLDPVTFISFLETGSKLINNKNVTRVFHEKKQYLDKKIEYFKIRGIVIDANTIFLPLSNQESFNITNPGTYICIKESQKLTSMTICGDNIHVNLNKKNIKCAQDKNIKMNGNNISFSNGSFVGHDTTVILANDISNFKIQNINIKLFYSEEKTCYGIHINSGHDGIIENCHVILDKTTSPVLNKTKLNKKVILPKKKYYKFNEPKKHFYKGNKSKRW